MAIIPCQPSVMAGEFSPFVIGGIDSFDLHHESIAVRDACTMKVSPERAPVHLLTKEQPAENVCLDALTHHLTAAARNMASLSQSHVVQQIVERVLDLCQHPLIAIDSQRRLQCANTRGMQVLKAGKVLHLAEGAVHASKFADAALSDAMRSAESPVQERRVVQLVPGPRSTVRLFVSPMRQDETFKAFSSLRHFLLLVHDSSSPLLGADPLVLTECFGLSPTEARVAVQLAQGAVIKQIAKAHGTSVSTIRTQVVSILNKTGVRRQADLVRLVAQLP